jgi:hypothetical protein
MKSGTQNGKLLEMIVFILEKCLTDNPSTVIRTNYKLPDKNSILRELDIYVETKVNGKLLKYAFECKHYKRGVELKHITDFHSKIDDLSIKGYFVTTSNYQKGAIDKAKALHIDLLLLKKIPAESNSLKSLLMFQKRFKVEDITIVGHASPEGINVSDVLNECTYCKNGILKIVEEEVLPYLLPHLDKGIDSMYPEFSSMNNIGSRLGEKNGKSLNAYATFDDGAQINHKGVGIPYHLIIVGIRVWQVVYEKQPKNVNSFLYLKHNDEGLLATFSIGEFYFNDNKVIASITKVEGSGHMLSIGKAEEQSSIVISKGVSIGTIKDLGLSDFGLEH